MLMMRYPTLRYLAALFLAVTGGALLWLPPPVAELTGYVALTGHAEGIVDEVSAQNLKAFLALSGVKAALAIVEGSSIGAGFQLQLGDAVQSVYDYVDFIWRMLMYSLLVLGAYKLLLDTELLYLGLQVIGAGMLIWAVGLGVLRVPGKIRLLGQRVVLIGILFAYVVPFALLATHYATNHYTGPLKSQHAEQMGSLNAQVTLLSGQMGALRNEISLLNPLDSVDAIRKRMTGIGESVTGTIENSTQAMVYYVVIVLFELLVFPLISALLLWKFLQLALGRVLDRPVIVNTTGKTLETETA